MTIKRYSFDIYGLVKLLKSLQIGGFLPFTTIDFPLVNAACVVFCQGCPWRCPYCQNRDLQSFTGPSYSWEIIFKKIEERKNFLDGVVFSGGEPLFQNFLLNSLKDIKKLGLKTALHTAGSLPERLKEVIPFVDWVGLDIKTYFDEYEKITGALDSRYKILKSLDILLENNTLFECRTTIDPSLVSPNHILKIAYDLRLKGVKTYALQECLDKDRNVLYTPCFEEDFISSLRLLIPHLIIRKK